MKAAVQQISPRELTHRLKGDVSAILLGVGSPAEYQAGHTSGARLAPVDEFNVSDPADLVDGADLSAYNPFNLTCHAVKRAVKAAQVLREAGVEHLALVQGGTEAWQRAGLEINTRVSARSMLLKTGFRPGYPAPGSCGKSRTRPV